MPAYTEFRNVTLNLTYAAPATTLPLDAIGAIKEDINKQEKLLASDIAALPIIPALSAVKVALTGRHPYQVHVFNFSRTPSSGLYGYEYIETVPTIEDITP